MEEDLPCGHWAKQSRHLDVGNLSPTLVTPKRIHPGNIFGADVALIVPESVSVHIHPRLLSSHRSACSFGSWSGLSFTGFTNTPVATMTPLFFQNF